MTNNSPPPPPPAIVGRDDETEVHIQGMALGAHRSVDVRIWRSGPSGFAPTRDGLTLQPEDLDALRGGIAELLEASEGGQRPARVVWEGLDGRRLRAETEPFGTRHQARLNFWQRVRDTWRPVDDGLVMDAGWLATLQEELDRLRPWLNSIDNGELPPPRTGQMRDLLDRWPLSGSDWLTVDPNRVAFHPRGIRITFETTEEKDRHWLVARQWRRDDSLWVPEPVTLNLDIVDLEHLLSSLRQVVDEPETGGTEFAGADSSTLRIRLDEDGQTLRVERRPPAEENVYTAFETRLTLPATYLRWFGRALAQGWSLLIGWLSEEERQRLQSHGEEEAPEEPTAPSESEPVATTEQEEATDSPGAEEPEPQPAVLGPVLAFGAESDTPGAVIPQEAGVRIVVEGYLLPRNITLPWEVAGRVLAGLENLEKLRQRQPRVDPLLLCDRPDCAVYGRVGTVMSPGAVELRVWTSPTVSESITFGASYLSELIERLRTTLDPQDRAKHSRSPSAIPVPSAPAHTASVAAWAPLTKPGPIEEQPATEEAPPTSVPIATISLGLREVTISRQRYGHREIVSLEWDGHSLELSLDDLGEMVYDVRALYYDAIRGRRGRPLSVGEYPITTISIGHEGAQLYLRLDQDIDGEVTSLSFPANHVPAFLHTLGEAMDR